MDRRIHFTTFRKLLESLENSDTAIRLRLSGEGWMEFTKLILLSESAMIVQDGSERRVIMNVRNIVEFEIDKPVLELSAFNPYEIMF